MTHSFQHKILRKFQVQMTNSLKLDRTRDIKNMRRFGGLQDFVGYGRLELVGPGFDGYNQPNQGPEFADVVIIGGIVSSRMAKLTVGWN